MLEKNNIYLRYQIVEATHENNNTFMLNPTEQGNKGIISKSIIDDLRTNDLDFYKNKKIFFQLFLGRAIITESTISTLKLSEKNKLQQWQDHLETHVNKAANYFLSFVPTRWIDSFYPPLDRFKRWFLNTESTLFSTTTMSQAIQDKDFFIALFWDSFDELSQEFLNGKSPEGLQEKLVNLQKWVGQLISPVTYFVALRKLRKVPHNSQQTISVIDEVYKTFSETCQKQQKWLEKIFIFELYEPKIKKTNLRFKFYQTLLNPITYFIQLKNYYDFLKDIVFETEDFSFQTIAEEKNRIFYQLQKTYSSYPQVRRFADENVLNQLRSRSRAENVREVIQIQATFFEVLLLSFKMGNEFLNFVIQHPFQTLISSLALSAAAAAAADSFHKPIDFYRSLKSVKRFSLNRANPEFLVNANTTGIQSNPFIIVNGDTCSILFECYTGATPDICVRAYNSEMVPISSQDTRLNSDTRNTQISPVGIVQNNEYRVFWSSDPMGNHAEIVMKRFDMNWNPLSIDRNVTSYLYDQISPSIAAGIDNSLLVWQHGVTTINYDIHGIFISLQGNLTPTDFRINNVTSGNQFRPVVAWTGIYYAVTFDSASAESGTGQGIIVRFLDQLGTFVTNDLLVNNQILGIQRAPTIASNLQNGLIAWEDTDNNVYGKFFTPSGQLQANQFRINTMTTASRPHVAVLPNSNYLITYEISDGTTYDVYGQEVTSSGQFVDPETRLNIYTNGNQQNPAVQGFFNGDFKNFIVAWQGAFSTDSDAVVARYFNITPPATTQAYTTGTTGTTGILASSTSSQITTGQQLSTSVSPLTTAITLTSSTTSSSSSSGSQSSTTRQSTTLDSSTAWLHTLFTTSAMTSQESTPSTTTGNLITLNPSTVVITSAEQSNSSSGSVGVPLIVGIAIGAAAIFLIATGSGVFVYRRYFNNDREITVVPLDNFISIVCENNNEIKEAIQEEKDIVIEQFRLIKDLDKLDAESLQIQTGIETKFEDGLNVINDYELGKGQFGRVKLGQHIETNQFVGVKILTKEILERFYQEKKVTIESLYDEALLQMNVSKEKHILPVHSAKKVLLNAKEMKMKPSAEKKYAVYIFMFLGYGNCNLIARCLNEFRKEEQNEKERIVATLLEQLLDGISNLHKAEKRISHNDLKPENIIFDKDGNLYITDFGTARKLRPSENHIACKDVVSDARYYSPKRYSEEKFNAWENDLWALGVSVCEMLLGRYPFTGLTAMSHRERYETCTSEWFKEQLNCIPEFINAQKGSLFSFLKEFLLLTDQNIDFLPAKNIHEILKKDYSHLLLNEKQLAKYFEKILEINKQLKLSEREKISSAQFYAIQKIRRQDTTSMWQSNRTDNNAENEYHSNVQKEKTHTLQDTDEGEEATQSQVVNEYAFDPQIKAASEKNYYLTGKKDRYFYKDSPSLAETSNPESKAQEINDRFYKEDPKEEVVDENSSSTAMSEKEFYTERSFTFNS